MLHHNFFLLFLVDSDGFSLNKRHYVDSLKKKKNQHLIFQTLFIAKHFRAELETLTGSTAAASYKERTT